MCDLQRVASGPSRGWGGRVLALKKLPWRKHLQLSGPSLQRVLCTNGLGVVLARSASRRSAKGRSKEDNEGDAAARASACIFLASTVPDSMPSWGGQSRERRPQEVASLCVSRCKCLLPAFGPLATKPLEAQSLDGRANLRDSIPVSSNGIALHRRHVIALRTLHGLRV